MDDEERLDQLESIATLLRNYVPVEDRTYKSQLYPSCFIASEAVDLLMKNGEVESRSEAVECLQSLMTTGVEDAVLFEHVRKSRRGNAFADDDQYYHFVKKEEVVNANGNERSSDDQPSNNDQSDVMDKYGFLIEDKKRYTESDDQSDAKDIVEQWQELIDKVTAIKGNILPSKLHDKIKHSTRKGLPDSMRQRAWTVFTGVDQIMNQSKGQYEMLLKQADFEWKSWIQRSSSVGSNGVGGNGTHSVSEVSGLTTDDHEEDSQLEEDKNKRPCHIVLEQIDRDISRTFPNHYLFQTLKEEKEYASGADNAVQNEIKASDSEGGSSVADEIKRELQSMVDKMNSAKLTNVNGISVAKIGGIDKSKTSDITDVDSNSTITPSSSKLSEKGHGKGALRRVLRAYSQYDSEVGYCQGMNFIVAMFLTFLSEEESFWLLVVVMNEDRYMLRALYGEDMSGTHEILYIADKLMKKFVPKLWKHLEKEGVHNSMFVTQWLLTLYTSSFPFDLVSRVWDSFLVEGWKVIYRVMLGLLKHAEPKLLEMRFEEILMCLREFPNMTSGETIMRESLQIGLKRKHVQKYVKAWRKSNPTLANAAPISFSRKDSNSSWTNDTNSEVTNDASKKKKFGSKLIPGKFRKKAEKEIVIEDLSPKLLPIVGSTKFALLIHNALTPEECEQLIDRAEKGGFEDASIYDRRTNRIHRKCQRWYEDDTALAQDWYKRILNALEDSGFEYKIRNAPWMGRRFNAAAAHPIQSVGLNERLRVLKYNQGEYFGSHCDPKFVRGPKYGDKAGDTSHVSVQIYLNDKFKGGQTRFHGGGRHYDVTPKTGSILLFDHNLLHHGVIIKAGKKYVVRTDVMYRKVRKGGDDVSTLSGLPEVVGLDTRQAL